MILGLHSLIEELELDCLLDEPDQLRQRIEALDRLDAYLQEEQLLPVESQSTEIYARARALYAKLEAVNFKLYEAIRGEIQRGAQPYELLQCVTSNSGNDEHAIDFVNGEGYDYLDELVSGVLQFERPETCTVPLTAEMVFYQPTPARHIFDLIGRAALTEQDVLVDLGSGLGHVPLIVSICSGAGTIGIELEPAYVECARQSANTLNLSNVTFRQQDARTADLSTGTIFYLYTPFSGTILRAVLDLLRHEAASREIRICTYGPCTATVAEESWLQALSPLKADRIVIFRSHEKAGARPNARPQGH